MVSLKKMDLSLKFVDQFPVTSYLCTRIRTKRENYYMYYETLERKWLRDFPAAIFRV